MSSTPVKKGRGVLLQLPNGHDPSGAAKDPIKGDDTSEIAADAEKKQPSIQVKVMPSNRPPLYSSPAVRRRSSLAANNSKRIRQSPHMKRVSFGGDTINIISQHRNEFRSPDGDSPTESSASHPHKSRKLSHPSSPGVRRSPAFVNRNQSLLDASDDDTVTLPQAPQHSPGPVGSGPPRPRLESRAMYPSDNSIWGDGGEGEDETVTLPKEPRISSSSLDGRSPPSPMPVARASPVPLRRSSMTNARQSFGIFLDDDISKGQGDVDLTDEHDVSFPENSLLSNQDGVADSDDDVTRDFGNITGVFNSLLDTDESVPIDLQADTESQGSLPPINSPPRSRPSNASSRKSLGYVGNLNLFNETTGDEVDTGRGRCSIAPAFGHRALDTDVDDAPRRFSVHSTMQIGDILQQVEQDEAEDGGKAHSISGSDEIVQAPSIPPVTSENVEVSELIPESNGKVKPGRSENVEPMPVVPERSGNVPPVPCPPESDGNVNEKEVIEESSGIVQTRPMLPENSASRPTLPDNRKLFDSDVTETLHFHEAAEVPKRPSIASESKPPLAQNASNSAQNPDTAAADHETGLGTSSFNARNASKPLPLNERDVDNIEAECEAQSGPHSSNMIVTPRSATGTRIRATASEMVVPGSATKVSTPLSAPGSKIRASFRDRTASGRRDGGDSQVQQLSDSVLMSSTSKPTPQHSSTFTIAEFLGASNIRFDDNILPDNRDPSLAPDMISTEIDRSSAEWRILQSVKKEKYLNQIEEELRKQVDIFNSTKQRIASLERDILTRHSPVFSLMSKSGSRSGKGVTNCRVGLKRLRKVSHFQNRLDWVLSRQKWEGTIRDGLQTAAASCQKDVVSLHTLKRSLVARHVELTEALTSSDIEFDRNMEDVSGSVDMRRKEVVDEFAYIQELRALTLSKVTTEKEQTRKREILAPKNEQLLAKLKNLQSYAGAQADRKLKAKVTERTQRNMLVCGMAGLRPSHIGVNAIVGTLAEMMEVELKLNGDMLGTVGVKAVTLPENSSSVIQSFVEGTVALSSKQMREIRSVREIPFAFHSSVEKLLYAKNFLEEALEYLDSHVGELSAASVGRGELPSLDVTLVGSFYSLTAWAKFDVTVTISTFFPHPTAGTSHQEVKDITIQRFIGAAPPIEDIQEVFKASGFRKNPQAFSVQDAFSAVWELL